MSLNRGCVRRQHDWKLLKRTALVICPAAEMAVNGGVDLVADGVDQAIAHRHVERARVDAAEDAVLAVTGRIGKRWKRRAAEVVVVPARTPGFVVGKCLSRSGNCPGSETFRRNSRSCSGRQ